MKKHSQHLKVTIFVVAFFYIVALACTPTAEAQETAVNIEGSWLITVTPPPVVRPPFHSLVSFSAGGVFIADVQNDLLPPVSSTQHGSWTRLSDGRIGSTQYSFIHDPAGHAIATIKVVAVYQLTDKDNLVGVGAQSLCDLLGQNCFQFPGSAQLTGTRITVEQLVLP
jgi:hypothetical protein